MLGLDGALKLASGVLDRVFPDPAQRAQAEIELRKADLSEVKVSIGAILAEANSKDPWTSRARPSFLYVMYAVIILAFVGGIIGIWYPAQMAQAAENIGQMLAAIPDSLWTLFGAGYLGYTGARSMDKRTTKK